MSWAEIYEAKDELEEAGHAVEIYNIEYSMAASCQTRWERKDTYIEVNGKKINASRETKSDAEAVSWMHKTAMGVT